MNLFIAFLIIFIFLLLARLVIIYVIKPITTRILYPEQKIKDYVKSNNFEFIKKEFCTKDSFNFDFCINFNFWDKFIYTNYYYKIYVRDNDLKLGTICVVFMKSGAVFVKDKIFFSKIEWLKSINPDVLDMQ